MKLHASVGAQILSSIDFPYPSFQLFVIITRTGTERVSLTGSPEPTYRLAQGLALDPLL